MSNIKLVPKVKEKWLKALRSGEYKKGKNTLRNSYDNSYCCLGVLCDVYSKETQDYRNIYSKVFPDSDILEWAFGVSIDEIKASNKNGYSQPIVRCENVKFGESKIEKDFEKNTSVLTEINDVSEYQKDFEEIAKIIEEQL